MRARMRALVLGLAACGLLALVARAEDKPQHSAVKPEPRLKKDKTPDEKLMKRHEGFVAIAKKGDVDVPFVGDSITDGWRGNGRKVFAKEFEPLKAANFGIGGDPAPSTSCGGCRTASWTASGPRSPC